MATGPPPSRLTGDISKVRDIFHRNGCAFDDTQVGWLLRLYFRAPSWARLGEADFLTLVEYELGHHRRRALAPAELMHQAVQRERAVCAAAVPSASEGAGAAMRAQQQASREWLSRVEACGRWYTTAQDPAVTRLQFDTLTQYLVLAAYLLSYRFIRRHRVAFLLLAIAGVVAYASNEARKRHAPRPAPPPAAVDATPPPPVDPTPPPPLLDTPPPRVAEPSAAPAEDAVAESGGSSGALGVGSGGGLWGAEVAGISTVRWLSAALVFSAGVAVGVCARAAKRLVRLC